MNIFSELCLRNCTAISSCGFAPLENLENLERLELYRTSIETDNLCSILRKNSNIRHLNLASMHERLNMDEVAMEIAVSCTKVESLDFWKVQTLTVQGIRALTHCTHLKEIDFGWWFVLIYKSISVNIYFFVLKFDSMYNFSFL